MNKVIIEGRVASIQSTLDHRLIGILEIPRYSNTIDLIPFMINNHIHVEEGSWIAINGGIRTSNYKNPDEEKYHKFTYVAGYLVTPSKELRNSVELSGFLVSKNPVRTTPKGKRIAEGVIALNSQSKQSSYPSIITWYEDAEVLANMPIGQEVYLKGRFQSRRYNKVLPDGSNEMRTALEISVSHIEAR